MSRLTRSPPALSGSNPELCVTGSGGAGSNSDLNLFNATTLRKRKQREPDNDFNAAFTSFTSEIKSCINDWRTEMTQTLSKISNEITTVRKDLDSLSVTTNGLKDEMSVLRLDQTKLETHVSRIESTISQDINDMKQSIEFSSQQQSSFDKRLSVLESNSKSYKLIEEKANSLELKMNNLDQQSRHCNIEITNVPDKRGENLTLLIDKIGLAINFPIPQKEIIAIHRVPHMQSDNKTPKNIIVKFASHTLRNNILSAYRLAKGLNTDQLGISGASHRIYMNEHLIMNKKLLFRECRSFAKEHNFKHAWVRNATILMRESDTSPIFKIQSSNDLKKIRARSGQKSPSQVPRKD